MTRLHHLVDFPGGGWKYLLGTFAVFLLLSACLPAVTVDAQRALDRTENAAELVLSACGTDNTAAQTAATACTGAAQGILKQANWSALDIGPSPDMEAAIEAARQARIAAWNLIKQCTGSTSLPDDPKYKETFWDISS